MDYSPMRHSLVTMAIIDCSDKLLLFQGLLLCLIMSSNFEGMDASNSDISDNDKNFLLSENIEVLNRERKKKDGVC